MLATFNPWWVGDPFNCHQWNPSQSWGHFQPGNRYSPTSSNHQTGNLWASHKLPQPKAAEPDLWDHAISFKSTQGCQKYGSPWECWMDLVGSPLLQFIPHVLFHSKALCSLPFQHQVRQMQGGEIPGWLASNWSTLTQDAQDNLGHAQLDK